MQVGIIGLGEVGRCYAHALAEVPNIELSMCEVRLSRCAVALADTLDIAVHENPGRWLASADWALSCVTGTHALDVASACLPHMRTGARYADLTTAAPDAKRSAADIAGTQGIGYADVAIMSAIAMHGARTPLLASGNAVDAFVALMAPIKAPVKTLPAAGAGDAISLKMLRSVFTKGMESLAVELLVAAENQGLREQLYEALSDIDRTPVAQFLERLVTTHVVHARRRLHEVEEAQQQLERFGVNSRVLPGVRARFDCTAKRLDTSPPPSDAPLLAEALAWLAADPVAQT